MPAASVASLGKARPEFCNWLNKPKEPTSDPRENMETKDKNMKVLCVEDNKTMSYILSALMEKWGYHPLMASNGKEALKHLSGDEPPMLILTDWMMPEMNGLELIKEIRHSDPSPGRYIIILSARTEKNQIVEGLEAGANDYIQKPFDSAELKCRVDIGRRTLELQHTLSAKIAELNLALDTIKTLEGLIPICMYCKKIRTDDDYWEQIESYIEKHSDAKFTHGICNDCMKKIMKENNLSINHEPIAKLPLERRSYDRHKSQP